MLNFEKGDKVELDVAGMKFERTVLEVDGYAVYLAEGGDAFDRRTGKVWGDDSELAQKTIKHAK